MIFESTALPGVIRVVQTPNRDARGAFSRLYCPEEFAGAGIAFSSTQINLSRNPAMHTLRGLHWQDAPHAEAKFIRITQGRVFEVVVDIREGSATRYQHITLELDAEKGDGLFIPEGFAHGFLTLEAKTDMLYQMGRPYTPGHARGLRWDDPMLAIHWPAQPILINEADASWPLIGGG
ncbi:MAG: dTDP-4-dehydrorhamnose 3,5-epimerase [Rhizobiales bacterium PAR1]|nr:MAG: dTDP-4-dehydrorhamnose 3,5-epimerase [Rhizobiales bacterium PAR1]